MAERERERAPSGASPVQRRRSLSRCVNLQSLSLSLLSRAVSASPSLYIYVSFSSTVSTEQQRAARERARERCSPRSLSPLPLLPPRLSVTQYRSIHKRLCLSVSLSPGLPVYATVSSVCVSLFVSLRHGVWLAAGNSKKLDQTELSLCESAISAYDFGPRSFRVDWWNRHTTG
jgi:hypothetical protein